MKVTILMIPCKCQSVTYIYSQNNIYDSASEFYIECLYESKIIEWMIRLQKIVSKIQHIEIAFPLREMSHFKIQLKNKS